VSEESPLVSVIIPVRDEEQTIEACIHALQSQSYPAQQLEIIVAEGASVDRSRSLVRRLASTDERIHLISNPSGGTAAALNLAIQAARGAVICRMDGHAVPEPTYIERCVASLHRTHAWAVGGRMIKASTNPVGDAIAAASSSRFGVGDSAFHYATVARTVESVYLGCWPRDVFDRVGMFDEELIRNQDDEFSYRIRAAGGSIWFDPAIAVTYRPRTHLMALFNQQREYGMWRIRVVQKHPSSLRWRHFVPGAFVAAVATSAFAWVSPKAGLVGALAALSYAAAAATASAKITRRSTAVRARHVFAAFVTMHVGYGVGLWQGLLRWFPVWFENNG
jgi:succinoglycan biosynthesis protein ExoA